MKALLRSKWVWGILTLFLLIGGFFFAKPEVPETAQQTFTVSRRELTRTVEASGSLKPGVNADLAFGTSGRLDEVLVREGDTVEMGEVLARLNMEHLDAQWARAQEAVAIASAQWEASVQARQDTDRTTDASIRQAESAVQSARIALENSESDLERGVADARLRLELALNAGIISVRDALSDADEILGIENSLTNDTFEAYLAANNPNTLSQAQASMRLALNGRERTENRVATLSDTDVEVVVASVEQELKLVAETLLHVRRVLDATTSNASTYSLADVASDKIAIDTSRASVQGAREGLQVAVAVWRDALGSSTETASAKQASLQVAERDAEQARATANTRLSDADSTVAIRLAGLRQAQADVAVLDAERAEHLISAPVQGVITRVLADEGERITLGSTILTVHSLENTWYADVQVPESDISLIAVGQAVDVHFDAYGDEQVFIAKVEHVDPSSQTVEGVVYYRVLLAVTAKEGMALRTGLSLDADIRVGRVEEALVIPQRAIFGMGHEHRVRVLLNDGLTTEERVITLGMRGDGGFVEVKSGLVEGDKVFLTRVSE